MSGLTRLQTWPSVVVNSAGSAWKHLAQPDVDQSHDCSLGAAQLCLFSSCAGGQKAQWEVYTAYLRIQTELFVEYPLCALPCYRLWAPLALLTLIHGWLRATMVVQGAPSRCEAWACLFSHRYVVCYLTPCSRTWSDFLCCSPHKVILNWFTIK